MKAMFTNFPHDSAWVEGVVDGENKYIFQAKLFNEGSVYGINKGRVSKLVIFTSAKEWIVNYDRGWDMEPKTKEHKKVYEVIMKLLEESELR